jgi:hypothetical protein
MKANTTKLFLTAALGAFLALGGNALAQPAKTPATTDKTKTTTTTAKPTAAEIADAKSKGMVWVNLNTKVYHKDGEYFGNTTKGKFMAEADAQKAGYKLAQDPAAKKKPAATTTKTTK